MKIILLGAPGSGKGTIAKQLSKDFNIPHISTGDLFRACAKSGSDLGQKLKSIMESGGLVSDDLTVEIVKERLAEKDCERGFILDGFPRTTNQAVQLEKISQIDKVILVELDNNIIVERLSQRRTCPVCGETVSINDYPNGICPKCASSLIQRDDDKPLTIRHRLEVYEQVTAPLIDFYSEKLVKVSNDSSFETTYKNVQTFLNKMEADNE